MRHVVMFSGGVGSWSAAKRIASQFGTESLTLLFTDTLVEDPDLYRFIQEGARNVGAELIRIAEGRTPWQVFHDERFLGNSRVGKCSIILKQRLADRWLAEYCDPTDTIIYTGIDWTEEHRNVRLRQIRKPWRYEAPMCEPPYLTKAMMLDWLRSEGIEIPYLYRLGFAHNNCAGGCVKAGIGHWVMLLRVLPERYAYHEAKEQEIRQYLGRDNIAILKDRTGNESRPMTLRKLRERIQAGYQPDMFDIAGCGCFVET